MREITEDDCGHGKKPQLVDLPQEMGGPYYECDGHCPMCGAENPFEGAARCNFCQDVIKPNDGEPGS